MAGRFTLEAVFKAVDKMSAPLSKMQNRVGKLGRAMDRSFNKLNRGFKKINDGANRIGRTVATGALIAGAGLAKLVSIGASFEKTLDSAAAKFKGVEKGSEVYDRLSAAAEEAGKTTEFAASQAAEGLVFLAMAGFNAEQAIAALPGVVDLATASGVDLATATDIATDSLGAFGLMSENAAVVGANLARVNDVMAATTTSANTSMEDMFETIKLGGPVATAAGASIETFAALTGVLANSGIKASVAGTTLKNIFLSLSAPGTAAAKTLKGLGVATKDSEGNMRDVLDILGDLNKATAGLGSADKLAALKQIFGKIPIAGVNVLLGEGADKLRKYRTELENSSGAAAEMAAQMRDNVDGSMKTLNSTLEGLAISIFKMNSGGIKEAIDKTTEWFRANEQLITSGIGDFLNFIIDNLDTMILTARRVVGVFVAIKVAGLAIQAVGATIAIVKGTMAAFAVVSGIVSGAMALLPAVMGAASAAMATFNVIMALNPIGLIVIGIGLLIAAGAALILAWDPVKAFFVDLWESISSGAEKAFSTLKSVGSIFGFGSLFGGDNNESDDETAFQGPQQDQGPQRDQGPQLVSPAARTARSIEETRKTSTSELTIKDESGRAEVTSGFGPGSGIELLPTGSF